VRAERREGRSLERWEVVLGIAECGTRDSEVIVTRKARVVGSVVNAWKAVWREGDAVRVVRGGGVGRGGEMGYL